jgi:hypothetical protein
VFSVKAEKAMAQSPFFSASCPAFSSTRGNGTVPLNQNLIQSRRRSFHRAGCYIRILECAGLLAVTVRSDSDHPIIENSQRWLREAIATVSA